VPGIEVLGAIDIAKRRKLCNRQPEAANQIQRSLQYVACSPRNPLEQLWSLTAIGFTLVEACVIPLKLVQLSKGRLPEADPTDGTRAAFRMDPLAVFRYRRRL